jgi:hypothetical protein
MTQIFAHIDDNGFLQGWYNTDVFTLEEIPTPRIEVTKTQWQNALDQNHNKIASDGTSSYEDPRSTEEIAEHELEVNNKLARRYLAETDWYVIRFQETGEAIPQEILDERAAARDRVI